MWIKICGMTDAAAVTAAVTAGADAIGFVLAPSVRAVEPRQAAALAQPARGRCRVVAVTLHPSQPLIDEILETLQPDILQTDWNDLASLCVPSGLQVLPVLRAAAPAAVALPPRVLFEGSRSGSGRLADWSEAAGLARRTQVVLAGGLAAGNIAGAIRVVRPYGVDVSSGVETTPGRKSAALIEQFIEAARAAAQDVA